MQTPLLIKVILIVAGAVATSAFSQDIVDIAAPTSGPTTIYRQVMGDGRIVYSDKAVKDAKIDHTLRVDAPIKGHSWTTESGPRPKIAAQSKPTSIYKVRSIPGANKKDVLDEATANVIRAEMLLEDAKRRQEEGVEPLPGERTGTVSGTSRLNETYEARQKLLVRNVAYFEAALDKATAGLNALR